MRQVTDLFATYGRMRDLGESEPYYSNLSLIFHSIYTSKACDILGPSQGHYVALSNSQNRRIVAYYIEPYSGGAGLVFLREILQEWANKAGANRVMASDPVSLYYVDC